MPKSSFHYLAWDIIREVNNQGGFVFGGFVRDFHSGDDFKDIDVFLPGNGIQATETAATVHELLHQGLICKSVSSTPYFVEDLWRRRYTIFSSNGKTSVNVDFIQRAHYTSMSMPFCSGTDADVNQLYMIGSSTYLWSAYPSDLRTVLKHIQNREFVAESTVSQERIQKMLDRGYTQVGSPTLKTPYSGMVWQQAMHKYFSTKPVHQVNTFAKLQNTLNKLNKYINEEKQAQQPVAVSEPMEVKCKVCKKNVTVDEAQCWWCGVQSPGR